MTRLRIRRSLTLLSFRHVLQQPLVSFLNMDHMDMLYISRLVKCLKRHVRVMSSLMSGAFTIFTLADRSCTLLS